MDFTNDALLDWVFLFERYFIINKICFFKKIIYFILTGEIEREWERERGNEREREREISHVLVYSPILAPAGAIIRVGPGSRKSVQVYHMNEGTQLFEPSAVPLRVQICTKLEWGVEVGLNLRHWDMGCEHPKQHLYH